MKRSANITLVFIVMIIAAGSIWTWQKIRYVSNRKDVRQMPAYGFANDLKKFCIRHHRLPANWDEYANWCSKTHENVMNDALWAMSRFKILPWGASVGTFSNDQVIVEILDPQMKEAQSDLNEWLRAILNGIDNSSGVP